VIILEINHIFIKMQFSSKFLCIICIQCLIIVINILNKIKIIICRKILKSKISFMII